MESLSAELGVLFERLGEVKLYHPITEMDQIGFAADLQHAKRNLKSVQYRLAGLEEIYQMCEDTFNALMGASRTDA